MNLPPGTTWLKVAVTIMLATAFTAMPAAGASKSTADHSKFKELQQNFQSGPEVTKACLSCHTEAAKQVQKTKHWTWEYLNPENKQRLGKKNVINNFCIAVPSNYAACTACHIGYGWKDDKFDFTVETNVDCLACHDTTGSYRKLAGMAGHVPYKDMEYPPGSGSFVKATDLKKVAQKVGKTSRDTCGACHFNGGGGNAVKHGDLDTSLEAPDKELDVHMDTLGLNFSCATCHKTGGHDVAGSRYAPTAVDRKGAQVRGSEDRKNPATCQSCHGQAPHTKTAKLNDHTSKLACQTCHVPSFARGGIATKMSWDWSTAGKMGPDGKPMTVKDDKKHVIYDTRKGDFVLAENVTPEYIWFNGSVQYTLRGDPVEKSDQPTRINRFEGSPHDGKSVIWPVKVFRGQQPYDTVSKSLVILHTTGNDDASYWKHFNWEKAIAAGMASVGDTFSGKFDFVKTEMTWPITHMVAPKDKAVGCVECHKAGGRLEKIEGVYIPGRSRDHLGLLDTAGWSLAALTLFGVVVHGSLRIATRKKKD